MTRTDSLVLQETRTTALQMLDGMTGTAGKKRRDAERLAALAIRHNLAEEDMGLLAFVHVEYNAMMAKIEEMIENGRTPQAIEGAYECREHMTNGKGEFDGITVSLLAEAIDHFPDATTESLSETLTSLVHHWDYRHKDEALRRLLLSAKERQIMYLSDFLSIVGCN